MAQEWELADRAEEDATDSSVRFECLWGSGTVSMGRAGIIFLMSKIGSRYFYFKGLLLLIENKKHLVFGSKTLDSRAIK